MAECLARCCECFRIKRDDLKALREDPESVRDGPYIAAMLRPITPQKAQKFHRAWGFVGWKPEPGDSFFKCKHFDPHTRLCRAYEDRPGMCRDYGTAKAPCKHGCGCG